MWYDTLPLSNNQINLIQGRHIPSTLKCDGYILDYFHRGLYQRFISNIDWTGLPDTWKENFLMVVLTIGGWVVVFDTGRYGVLPQIGRFHGRPDVQLQPRKVLVKNEYIDREDLVIGDNCEIIALTPDYFGILDILDYYAVKLAIQDSSINQSIINSRQAHVFLPRSRAQAESLKKMEDKITSGETSVYMDGLFTKNKKDALESFDDVIVQFDNHIGNNFLTDKQFDIYRRILLEFDAEIGLPNNPGYDKKQEQTIAEVETNNAETDSRITTMINTLQGGVKKVNAMFGLSISVKQREFTMLNSGSAQKRDQQGERNDLK